MNTNFFDLKGLISMASVIVSWSGNSDNRKSNKNLCDNLKEIADLSHSYFQDVSPVKYFNQTAKGRIIIDGNILDNPVECSQLEKITQLPLPEPQRELSEETKNILQRFFGTSDEEMYEDTSQEQEPREFFIAKEINLYGLEFRLFDPRDYDTEDNRISFVFASIDSCPSPNGLLVHVENHKECLKYNYRIIKDAKYFLTNTSIHLRYYCEHWMDMLLGYVKYFYIPNLHYWHEEDLNGYDRFLKLVGDFGGKEAESKILNMLKEELKDDINSWS